MARPVEERFREQVVRRADGCWEWGSLIPKTGYRTVSVKVQGKLRTRKAHRVIYELLVGPIPAGLTLDHLCRNRGCVNPAHLEPVTVKVNVLRGEGLAAQNAQKTHCPKGHEYSPENTGNYINQHGPQRVCLECKRAHAREPEIVEAARLRRQQLGARRRAEMAS